MYIKDLKRLEEKLPRICENLNLPASLIEKAWVTPDWCRMESNLNQDRAYRVDLGSFDLGVNLFFRKNDLRLVRVIFMCEKPFGHKIGGKKFFSQDSLDDEGILGKTREGL